MRGIRIASESGITISEAPMGDGDAASAHRVVTQTRRPHARPLEAAEPRVVRSHVVGPVVGTSSTLDVEARGPDSAPCSALPSRTRAVVVRSSTRPTGHHVPWPRAGSRPIRSARPGTRLSTHVYATTAEGAERLAESDTPTTAVSGTTASNAVSAASRAVFSLPGASRVMMVDTSPWLTG